MDTLDQFTQSLADKNVLIFGLGLQGGGVGSVKFFSHFSRSIRVTDLKTEEQLKESLDALKDISFTKTLGEHRETDIEWADIVVVNQDVWNKAPDSPYIVLAQKMGKQIETETGLFCELCQCPIIGITGTRGKTTTTVAISSILKAAGLSVVLGGNIPQSENLEMLEKTRTADYAVLELSSFQLHGLHLKKISPHIAVITSISPDHLSSYPSMEAYVEDKKAVYCYQKPGDHLVIKEGSKWSKLFSEEACSSLHYFSSDTLPPDLSLSLPGKHNRENMGAAYVVGKILGLEEEGLRSALSKI
jgi:UDP-N-acetylmuramoylalanine--D-glutamate ligase